MKKINRNSGYADVNALLDSMRIGSEITVTATAYDDDGKIIDEKGTSTFTKISDDDYAFKYSNGIIDNDVISRNHMFHILLEGICDARYNDDPTFSVEVEETKLD